ncbi:hypothetical protein HN51_061990, partial [Arachis hypogaea]
IHTKRKNQLKAKTINNIVLDELDFDEKWIVADKDGEEEDLDDLISYPEFE